MALTPKQQRFLDEYVRKHALKGQGKRKRADGFSTLRDAVSTTLASAPALLPQYGQLVAAMNAADDLGNQLKFDRAAAAMQQVLDDTKRAVAAYQPPADPLTQQVGDPNVLAQLTDERRKIVADRKWKALTEVSGAGGDLKMLGHRSGAILEGQPITAADLKEAKGLIDEMRIKRDFQLHRLAAIDKRREQLRKYSKDITSDADLYPDNALEPLLQRAQELVDKDGRSWNRADEAAATTTYLEMLLVLSGRDDVKHKDFKEGQQEMVLAVRRKMKAKPVQPGDTEAKYEANFKLVVKPASKEIAGVAGFKPGGGAPREAMGSVIGNKLQEMLGLDLNVAPTQLVKVDGGRLGLEAGTEEIASAQAFVGNARSLQDRAVELAEAEATKLGLDSIDNLPRDVRARIKSQVLDSIPREEVQSKAVFDLISLHADRHDGNFLMDDAGKLLPIDHGNILPSGAGLRGRATELGPSHAALAQTQAAQQPLSPELIERVERLNVDELINTARGAAQEMKNMAASIDSDDLEAGLRNMRRSAEFMKFAVRQLTVAQIYKAYECCQDEIFFTDETEKLQSFTQAVKSMKERDAGRQALETKIGGGSLDDTNNLNVIAAQLHQLGWFPNAMLGIGVVLDCIGRKPARVNEILTQQLRAPQHPVVNGAPNCPKSLLSKQPKWDAYVGLGGDEKAGRLGYPRSAPFPTRLGALEAYVMSTGRFP